MLGRAGLGCLVAVVMMTGLVQATILVDDDFESDATNTLPAGWSEVGDPENGTARVIDTLAHGGTKSFFLNDTGTVNGEVLQVKSSFTAVTDRFCVVDYWARAGQVDRTVFIMSVKAVNNNIFGAARFYSNATITYNNGTDYISAGSYDTNTWYNFKYVIDLEDRNWDFYLDGILKGSDLGFYSAAAVDDPDKIESYGIWSGAGSWYLDDVTVSTCMAVVYVNHIGYLSHASKKVVVISGVASSFDILDDQESVVFTGDLAAAGADLGNYVVGDFTSFTSSGTYRIRAGQQYSRWFPIGDGATDNYDDALQKCCDNYHKKQRCGDTTVNWRGQACHLDDGKRTDNGEHHNCVGGWHDACDLRKWVSATIMAMDGLEAVKRNLNPSWDSDGGILDELKWGNLYFLKMQDDSGYIYQYCGGDDGNYWTDNEIGTADDRPLHVDCAGHSNYQFIGVQAALYNLYKSSDPVYAQTCLTAATNCYNYCKTQWPDGVTDDKACGYEIFCGIQLYLATGNLEYKNFAVEMANNYMSLQEKIYIGNQTEIKGFFYTNSSKTEFSRSRWREPMGLIALCTLCETFPGHSEYVQWKECIRLYVEDYLLVMANKNAFSIICHGLYSSDPGGSRQIGDLHYRYFFSHPVWAGLGMNNSLLGTAAGLVKASKILEEPQYRELALRQLDWVLGNNPFDASTVTGVGYNQPTLYEAGFTPPTPLIDGGIMNGICGDDDDVPQITDGSFQNCEYWTPQVCYFERVVSELLYNPQSGRWHFNEGEGTTAQDASGNGNHGTLMNMATETCWVGGKIGKALEFDGSDDYVDCGDDASLDITDEITIEAWVNPTSGTGYIISKNIDSATDNQYAIYWDGDQVMYYPSGTPISAVNSVPTGAWTHIVFTRTGTTGQFYINGVASGSPAACTMYSRATSVNIGRRKPGNFYFNGSIDDVAIYARALSANEVHQRYLEGADTDSDGLPDSWEQQIIDADPGDDINSIEDVNPGDDFDADGLTNLGEYNHGTDPANPDTDSDDMPDGWEVDNGLNPLIDDASLDPDGDGYTNLQEYRQGTDPQYYTHSLPYETGFEPEEGFVLGNLDAQNGWQVTEGTAEVETNTVHSGTQAVTVSSGEVRKSFGGTNNGIQWIDLYLQPIVAHGNTPPETPCTSLIYFDFSQGIMCYDGAGDGTGEWVPTGVSVSSNTWYRISIKQDYTAQTWEVYVDGDQTPKLTGLGFKDNLISLNNFSMANSGYLDDLYFGSVSALDRDDDGLPDSWEQQIIDADSGDDINSIEDVNPGDDFDADGLTNAGEYDRGTNPTEPDTDSDDMPDGWEVDNGLNPLVDDASLDPDGDGQSNYSECVAGTGPLSASSLFKIVEAKQNDAEENYLDISWTFVEGKTYTIYYSNDSYSDAMNFYVVTSPTIDTNDTTLTWTDDGTKTGGISPGEVEHRYYKVKVE